MGETGLSERFARFEAEVPDTFRPAPVAELAVAVRRRRWLRRALFAGVLALLVGGPAGAVAVAGRHHAPPGPLPLPVVETVRPPVVATPSVAQTIGPSASPTPEPIHPIERTAALPGVDIPTKHVFVMDARRGWVWYEACPVDGDPGSCRYALGSTSDGGVTWHRVNLPDLAKDRRTVIMTALDLRTIAFYVVGTRYWMTTDGGATYTSYPLSKPPVQAQLAYNYPYPGNRFRVLCPGATGFEDGALGIDCEREQVVRIGSGPVANQPTLPGKLGDAFQAADGRIWLTSADGGVTRVAVSTDDTRTWTELASVAGNARLSVSPDGTDVWLVEEHLPNVAAAAWRLTGSRFVAQSDIPYDFGGVSAVGGGMLVGATADVGKAGPVGFWFGGAFHPIPGLTAPGLDVLPDGTLTCRLPDGSLMLGVGTGTDRTWYHLS